MALLSNDWITMPLLDFEYKQYILLDYLKQLETCFHENKIYPYLSDVKAKLKSLSSLIDLKNDLDTTEFKRLNKPIGFDFNEFELAYKKRVSDTEALSEISAIMGFALPLFQKYSCAGETLKNEIETKLHLIPVGILPLQNKEGYLFLNATKQTRIYRYRYSIISAVDENLSYQDLRTTYITTVSNSVSNTLENIKYTLIKEIKELPNPAVYFIEAEKEFPFIETLLPLAKYKLMSALNFL